MSSEQWDSPTLCEHRRAREVAAHAISFDKLNRPELVRRFLRGQLSVDRINAIDVADYAERSPKQLIGGHAQPHGLTAGFGGKIALTDNMIH